MEKIAVDNKKTIKAAQQHLLRFGYLKKGTFIPGILDDETQKALKIFRWVHDLIEIDVKQPIPIDFMKRARCGLPDSSPLTFKKICGWKDKTQLTFAFDHGTTSVPNNDEWVAVRNAFRTWQAFIPLDFVEVQLNQNPDVVVDFRNASDADLSMIGSTIAHADYPPGCSVLTSSLPLPIHFDDSEVTWSVNNALGTFDVESVALHEIGHILGLDHSTPGTVMQATIGANAIMQALTQDDIDGAQALYGKRLQLNVKPPLAAITRNADQMDVFGVNRDGGIYSSWWNGDPWRDWFRLGNASFAQNTPVTAISRNDDQMDIFAVALDGAVLSIIWNGNPWGNWYRINSGVFAQHTPIAVLSRNDDFIDLFAVGLDNGIWSTWWNGSWNEWFRIGVKNFAQGTTIAAISRNDDQMDIFAVADDGCMWSAWWNGSWNDWFRIGSLVFSPGTPVAALTRNDDQMDIFAVADDGGVVSAWWNGNPWSEWFRIGAQRFPVRTPVAAVSRNDDQMDLFLVGEDGGVYTAWWNGNWSEWFRIGTHVFEQRTAVTVISRDDDHMDLFAVDPDGTAWSAWWNGNWSEWFRLPVKIVI